MGLVAAIALAFAAFGMHILSGAAYEQRTVIAMGARLGVWLLVAATAYRLLRRG
jgi:hypothetical protein